MVRIHVIIILRIEEGVQISMKIKKIALYLFVIAIGCIVTGVVLLLNIDDSSNEAKAYTYSYGDSIKADICTPSNPECSVIPFEYSTLVYDTKVKEIQNFVSEINGDMTKYYEQVKNSDMSDSSCAAVKDLYQHSITYHFDIAIYETKELTNITASYLVTNLCTNTQEYLPVKTFAYDKNSGKVLSQKELMSKYNITNQKVEAAIQSSLDSKNSIEQTNYSLEDTKSRDYIAYFDRDGVLIVLYYLEPVQTYFAVTL